MAQPGGKDEIDEMIEKKVKEVIKSNNKELLESINGMFNNCNQISDSSSLCSTHYETPVLKRKSNQEQFKQNARVLENLEGAEKHLNAERYEKAKEQIIEAKDALKRRQKLIQVADSSELGWRVVAEYEQNPIASDSEDEKKMYKAEARASRKAKSEKAKKSKTRNWPNRRPKQPETTPSVNNNHSQQQQYYSRRQGLCFNCGKPGHWKNECSRINTNNKISTHDNYYPESKTRLINNVEKQTDLSDKMRSLHETQNIGCEKLNSEKTDTSECTYQDQQDVYLQYQVKGQKIDHFITVEGQNIEQFQLDKKSNEICQKIVSPVGRLKGRIEKWKQVSDNEYILSVIENGYKLPLKQTLESVHLRNNKTARENPDFVKSEINSLQEKGIVSEVKEKPYVINPLTVAHNRAGNPRLILDCRHVNPYLHKFKIKFEDIKMAEHLFDPSNFVYTFDLKSAYHHIDIFKSHTGYLGFSCIENGSEKYYVFNSLPFGISTAGHIFTKVLRVLIKFWRSLGHRVIMFLDDGIGGHANYENAKCSSDFVHRSLKDFGFMLAAEKCCWIPSKITNWLGHTLDYENNLLFVTQERISRLEASIDSLIFQIEKDQYDLVHVRYLASIVGQIISLQNVVGKKVSLRTRKLYTCIINRASWNSPVLVTKEAMSELEFWRENARALNQYGKSFKQIEIVSAKLYCDASAVGYGGYVEKERPITQIHTNISDSSFLETHYNSHN